MVSRSFDVTTMPSYREYPSQFGLQDAIGSLVRKYSDDWIFEEPENSTGWLPGPPGILAGFGGSSPPIIRDRFIMGTLLALSIKLGSTDGLSRTSAELDLEGEEP
jgi:hypothetical protein